MLFREAEIYFDIIDAVLPVALRHEYRFMENEVFNVLKESQDFNISMQNQILVTCH